MFSQTVEYALRAVVHLASESPNACTTGGIARVTRVPQAYLAKVLQNLVQAGVLRSQRGLGGGISLVKSPEELTLLDVVNAVDPIRRIKTCPINPSTNGSRLCALHRRLDSAMAMVERAFSRTTMRDLLDEPAAGRHLCESPVAVMSPE
ncbi:MAG: Rrf2 family transcriptional regulator [Planctomycetes bacterium]|nr:Rrf2 family transcriptional regulator [Planctomycetota bacterium]